MLFCASHYLKHWLASVALWMESVCTVQKEIEKNK